MLLLAGIAGCSSPEENAQQIAARAGLYHGLVKTDPFTLTTYSRLRQPGKPLVVYLEGDGFAWKTRRQPSSNPTPRHALGLSLAALDRSANVAYLARPCQFTAHDGACDVAYWTHKRFTPEVVKSLNAAITHFVRASHAPSVHLVGYSGGGTLAALIAASRQDVASLRTLAGNLDVEAFNEYHQVQPMPQSLTPLSIAGKLATIPQVHYVGDHDTIVPPTLIRRFLAAQGSAVSVKLIHVPNATHTTGWLEFWSQR